ncbi:IS3 family transposase, partial [Mycolicibacterium mucogenicum]|uniref:IS3 family transposase n=1 Tax=Mycolicibacterium mucogenicum TaxID=56689 RepID=UPI000A8CE7D6
PLCAHCVSIRRPWNPPLDGYRSINALAETTIGLYKNECVRADSPFRRGPLNTVGDVEYITADYVAWYNQQRLMHRLGRIPPAEAEARYYSQLVTGRPAGSQKPEGA